MKADRTDLLSIILPAPLHFLFQGQKPFVLQEWPQPSPARSPVEKSLPRSVLHPPSYHVPRHGQPKGRPAHPLHLPLKPHEMHGCLESGHLAVRNHFPLALHPPSCHARRHGQPKQSPAHRQHLPVRSHETLECLGSGHLAARSRFP